MDGPRPPGSRRVTLHRVSTRREFPVHPGQEGLATLHQLAAAGWTRAAVRHRLRTVWHQPAPGVVAPHRVSLSTTGLLVAAGLWAGPHAVLTGVAALRWWGVEAPTGHRALFLAPAAQRARQCALAELRRSRRPPPESTRSIGRSGPLRVASAAAAMVDAACRQAVMGDDAEALTISLLQRGLATPEEVAEALAGRPRRLTEGVSRGVAAFTQGAWSRPERVLQELTRSAGLGGMLANHTVWCGSRRLGVPDGFFPDAGVVVQVHSRRHHQGVDDRGGDQWARTVEADSAYSEAGLLVVGVTPWSLHRRPQEVVQRIRRALAAGVACGGSPGPVRWER